MKEPNTHTAVNPILETAFENHEFRVFGDSDQPQFIVKDVCGSLDLTNVTEATKRLETDELTSVVVKSGGQNREMLAVGWSGLFALVFQSRKETAKRFRRWVTGEVLPAIMKQGFYGHFDGPLPEDEEVRELTIRLEAAQLRRKASALEAAYEHARSLPEGMTVNQWLFREGIAVTGIELPKLGYIMACAAKRNGWPVGYRKSDGRTVKAYHSHHIALTLAPKLIGDSETKTAAN